MRPTLEVGKILDLELPAVDVAALDQQPRRDRDQRTRIATDKFSRELWF
jgi:hypothetical protein